MLPAHQSEHEQHTNVVLPQLILKDCCAMLAQSHMQYLFFLSCESLCESTQLQQHATYLTAAKIALIQDVLLTHQLLHLHHGCLVNIVAFVSTMRSHNSMVCMLSYRPLLT